MAHHLVHPQSLALRFQILAIVLWVQSPAGAQIAAQYKQAAAAYRSAAQQGCDPQYRQCNLRQAAYNDCLAAQLGPNGPATCNEPPQCGNSGCSSGSGATNRGAAQTGPASVQQSINQFGQLLQGILNSHRPNDNAEEPTIQPEVNEPDPVAEAAAAAERQRQQIEAVRQLQLAREQRPHQTFCGNLPAFSISQNRQPVRTELSLSRVRTIASFSSLLPILDDHRTRFLEAPLRLDLMIFLIKSSLMQALRPPIRSARLTPTHYRQHFLAICLRVLGTTEH